MGAETVVGVLVRRPLSAAMLTVYSVPGLRPLRVWVSALPGTVTSALWPSGDACTSL